MAGKATQREERPACSEEAYETLGALIVLHEPINAAELAQRLGIRHAAAKARLLEAHRRGWVSAWRERPGAILRYAITDHGRAMRRREYNRRWMRDKAAARRAARGPDPFTILWRAFGLATAQPVVAIGRVHRLPMHGAD